MELKLIGGPTSDIRVVVVTIGSMTRWTPQWAMKKADGLAYKIGLGRWVSPSTMGLGGGSQVGFQYGQGGAISQSKNAEFGNCHVRCVKREIVWSCPASFMKGADC